VSGNLQGASSRIDPGHGEVRSVDCGKRRREMAEWARRRRDPVATQLIAHRRHVDHGLGDEVDVRLRVHASWNRQAHQIEGTC